MKYVFFIPGGWNAKGGSKEIHGVTGKFDLAVEKEAGQRLTEFCQNVLVIANTLLQQHKRLLCTWTSPDIRLIIFFAVEDGEAPYSEQKQNQELTVAQIMNVLFIAKFSLKLNKVGKTTSSFRYDLNQIPYDYIVEVTNRFKGLDLMDRLPNVTFYRRL